MSTESKPIFSDRTYGAVKNLVQLGLPAAGTLYFTLASIWDLPAAEQVIGTIAAVNVFFGVLLSFSSRTYKASDARFAGDVVVTEAPNGRKTFSLELNDLPETLEEKSEVLFKVVPAKLPDRS
jgi:Putative phage holin Dp-1